MNDPKAGFDIRRILVALDASPHSDAALEAAVRMAARFEAELMGLYVEDVNVLRLADLPFVREVGTFSSHSRRVEANDLERQLRVRSLRIRRKFVAHAAQQQIQQVFRVTRGQVVAEIRTAARDADVLIVGRAGWSYLGGRRLGSTARAVYADDAPRFTLLLQQGTRLGSPMLVVYDGSPPAQKALEIAAALMETRRGVLRVLLLANGQAQVPALREKVRRELRDHAPEAHIQALTESSVGRLTRTIRDGTCATLVVPAKIGLLQDDAVLALMEALDVPVLLVR